MDVARHFETYRASLKKDALEGCVEYAKAIPTAKPASYPTVYDYLNHALAQASQTASKKDHKGYVVWVQHHQKAMVALFDRMVDDVLWGHRNTTTESIYTLVKERGWNWFKFCRKTLEVDMTVDLDGKPTKVAMAWVPRYDEQFKDVYATGSKTVLDADELSWFLSKDMTPKDSHPVLYFKMENPWLKFLGVDGKAIRSRPVVRVNEGGEVVDWSLPLF